MCTLFLILGFHVVAFDPSLIHSYLLSYCMNALRNYSRCDDGARYCTVYEWWSVRIRIRPNDEGFENIIHCTPIKASSDVILAMGHLIMRFGLMPCWFMFKFVCEMFSGFVI